MVVYAVLNKDDWAEKLEEATQTNKLVVVDFTATWCPPCRAIAPFFAELAEKYPDVLFLKVDVDAQSDIAAEYNVRAMPTFKFLKDGVVIDELIGGNRQKLEKKVQQNTGHLTGAEADLQQQQSWTSKFWSWFSYSG